MIYAAGVEDIEPDHWVAWAFAKPGLTGSGTTPEAAVGQLRALLSDGEVHVIERFASYPSEEDPAYLINAFFADDQRPLTSAEVDSALDELEASRRVFLAQIEAAAPNVLARPIPGEKCGSISGLVRHIAVAEWWYCHRLDNPDDWASLPDDPLAALAFSRQRLRALLPTWIGDTRAVTRFGEGWSARKVLRRALWHERDHTQHIAQRLRQLRA